MRCPLTPYEASCSCTLRLGSTPSLLCSSRFTLRSILTAFLHFELYRYTAIATFDLRLRPSTSTCDCDLRLRPATATFDRDLRPRSTTFVQTTATLFAPALDVYHTTPLFPYPFYTSTSSLYLRSNRIKRLALSALASAAYHSQIQPLTTRLGVCSVFSFFQARASASTPIICYQLTLTQMPIILLPWMPALLSHADARIPATWMPATLAHADACNSRSRRCPYHCYHGCLQFSLTQMPISLLPWTPAIFAHADAHTIATMDACHFADAEGGNLTNSTGASS